MNKNPITGVEEVSYYVKVVNVTSDSNFSITLQSNLFKTSYADGYTYCKDGDSKSKTYQPLFYLITDKEKISKPAKKTIQFSINVINPAQHKITIKKVDENGDALAGATFAYKSSSVLAFKSISAS